MFAFWCWCRVRGLFYRTGVARSFSARSLPLSLGRGGAPLPLVPSVGRSFARCPVVRARAPRLKLVCRSGACLIPARRLRAGCGCAAPGCVALLLALSPIIRARGSIIAARANVKGKVACAPRLSPPLTLALNRCLWLNIGRGISTALSRSYPKKEGVTHCMR